MIHWNSIEPEIHFPGRQPQEQQEEQEEQEHRRQVERGGTARRKDDPEIESVPAEFPGGREMTPAD